jgi:hypothetical protein
VDDLALFGDDKASLQAWNAHASSGDTWRLRDDVFRNNTFSFVR